MLRQLIYRAIHCACLLSATALYAEDASKSHPATPKEVISLHNGKDLSNFYTWLTDDLREDPRKVFSIQPDGTLRVSGDGFGGLITHKEYENYHLVLEYRWGTETYRSRVKASRDNGLLLHCKGPDGGFGGSKGKPGPWMTSIECQIIEGGVGDILVLSGPDENGNKIPAAVTCNVTRDVNGQPCWDPKGKEERFLSGRVNWYGRDPKWKDVLGVRGEKDVESPGQEWTKLECICDGDTLTYLVNGTVVNKAKEVLPRNGKILLQTEGAEMFVRKFELHPIAKAGAAQGK